MPVDTDSNTEGSLLQGADPDTSGEPTAGHDRTEATDQAPVTEVPAARKRRSSWTRLLSYALLPGLALALALGVGYLKWQDHSSQLAQTAAAESVSAATDTTIAMLSYQPDSVEKDLTAASDRMTGAFRDEYTKLINDVVIPGAKQKQITATASVPAAASISATKDHATALIYINQTTIIGADPPTNTASSVRVTLNKQNDKWLISKFEPV